jgi:transposase
MFLPAYSPEFNLIELGWHSCNEFVASTISVGRATQRTLKEVAK